MIERVINLGSSSKGNAYLLKLNRKGYDKPFGLLIECGFPFGELLKRLNDNKLTLSDVDACVITHKHHDHSLSVNDLLLNGIRVYAPQQVYVEFGIDVSKQLGYAKVVKEKTPFAIANKIVATPIPLKHDENVNMAFNPKNEITLSSDYEPIINFGYIITINGEYNILFIIDTMYLPYRLDNYKFDVIFIESNYFARPINIAYQNAKKNRDYGNQKRYGRLIYSHLSLETATKIINNLDLEKTKTIFITHTSSSEKFDEKKYHDLFLGRIKKQKNINVVVCKRNGGLHFGKVRL